MIVSNEHFPNVLKARSRRTTSSRHGDDVTPIDTEPANAGGACWNVITKNDKYVLVTSPFTLNINSFRIEHDGQLTPVNGDSVVATAQGLTLDEALSNDSKYLYVLVDDPNGVRVLGDQRVQGQQGRHDHADPDGGSLRGLLVRRSCVVDATGSNGGRPRPAPVSTCGRSAAPPQGSSFRSATSF